MRRVAIQCPTRTRLEVGPGVGFTPAAGPHHEVHARRQERRQHGGKFLGIVGAVAPKEHDDIGRLGGEVDHPREAGAPVSRASFLHGCRSVLARGLDDVGARAPDDHDPLEMAVGKRRQHAGKFRPAGRCGNDRRRSQWLLRLVRGAVYGPVPVGWTP